MLSASGAAVLCGTGATVSGISWMHALRCMSEAAGTSVPQLWCGFRLFLCGGCNRFLCLRLSVGRRRTVYILRLFRHGLHSGLRLQRRRGTVNTYGFCAAAQQKHPGTKCSLNRAFLLMFQSDRLPFLSIWLYTFIIACLPVIVKNRSRNLRNTRSGLYFLPSNISDQKPNGKVTHKFRFF